MSSTPLICTSCKNRIAPEGENWKCSHCSRVFTYNQGVLSFLTDEERFNEGVYQEKQIAAWTASARLRNKIRDSKLLSFLNAVRVNFSLSGRRDRIFWKELRRRRQPDRLILDIGCGGGRHYFCNFGKVIGIDPVLPLLHLAAQNYAEVYQTSGFALPFGDASIDYVVSSDVLGHINAEDKDRLFSEIKRVLKPGGRTIHCIEAESTAPWCLFAHRYPELYQVYFIDKPGHIGMELPSAWNQRFVKHGFRQITFNKLTSRVMEPGTLTAWFDNEYKAKSKLIRTLLPLDRLLSRSFAVKEAINFLLEPLAQLDDWLTPLDYGNGILVVYEKPLHD